MKTSFRVLRLRAQAFSRRASYFCALIAAAILGEPTWAAIAFSQANGGHTISSGTSTVTFTGAQGAGNLNVVVVGWANSTSNVNSVTDSKGNTYVLAIGPTRSTGNASQSVYYAKNIATATAGSNTVTVVFSTNVPAPNIRIAEYSGLDTASPLDVTVGAVGSGTSTSSGSVTTTNANDLIVGTNYVENNVTGPGSGYTQRTNFDGDILEDKIVSATGSYSATAPQSPSGYWIMQLVALKAASGGGGDIQAPTVPTGLAATAVSSSQINVSWNASSDNVGVTGYQLQRCQGSGCTNFADLALPSGTSFNDTGLSASTTYRYQVRARDAVPNWSQYTSTPASATTQAAPDTVAPSVPTGLSATAVSSSQINVTWNASNDNVGVTGYQLQRCQGSGCTNFADLALPSGTSFNDTGLSASTTYRYQVRARDAVPNWSQYTSTPASATTQAAPDTVAPSVPTGLSATAVSSSQINVTWNASNDNVGVTGYQLQRCQGSGCTNFADLALPSGTSFNDTGLSASTTYRYQVRARDAVPNWSQYTSVPASATTQAPADTQAPTPPTSLTIIAASSNEIDLVWTASSDNVGVTAYVVERCAGTSCSNYASVGTVSTPTPPATLFNNTSLSASTSYSYRVYARDAANNPSAPSNVVSYQTPANSPDCN